MLSLLLFVLELMSLLRLAAGAGISLRNCTDHCGNVQIPYPFGIGASCCHDSSYEIICNASFKSPKPFLRLFNLEVLDITLSSSEEFSEILTLALPALNNICGSDGGKPIRSYDLRGTPYRFSMYKNNLMMEGCGGSAILKKRNGEILAGCASICDKSVAANGNETTCHGVGCCESHIVLSNEDLVTNWQMDYYEIDVSFQREMKYSCNASVAVVAIDWIMTRALSSLETIPTALEWHATWVSDDRSYGKSHNVYCEDSICHCPFPYEGNPYIPNGCQVIQEYRKCPTHCDSGFRAGPYCVKQWGSFLGFIISAGVVLLASTSYWLYRFVKRRREIKRKAKHFKRNGGLLLQQQISCKDGVVETTKIFSVTELEKATDNFNENRILGKGGQGTVYKGMLMDGKIVAVKKATMVDESQVEQFVNEVVILSQINHRNVVKLLGCCLETEVPMLIYEFISNGTLYEHLHGENDDFHVTWKMRLQIAAESAGAVAYLHSSSSAPIYHRDIKSTNILLDEKFRAKVSDFGTSKAITIEQTHVTTAVLGTFGYMDPEYFQSNQFTEKSDVYSFGVVIVELLTGKKPICPTGDGGWINLASEFLTQMEDSHLFKMIDTRIIDEGKAEEFMAVAKLAKRCLNMNGKRRPTMKEISVKLDGIRHLHMPIFQEPSPGNNDQIDTELIYSDTGPFSQGILSSDVDLNVWSIEVQPLRSNT